MIQATHGLPVTRTEKIRTDIALAVDSGRAQASGSDYMRYPAAKQIFDAYYSR